MKVFHQLYPIIDEAIPDESMESTPIKVRECTFIKNASHWQNFRNFRLVSPQRPAKREGPNGTICITPTNDGEGMYTRFKKTHTATRERKHSTIF